MNNTTNTEYHYKLLLVFSRLEHHIYKWIYNSRYIATEDKDGLWNKFKSLQNTFDDVYSREKGVVKNSPSVAKQIEKIKTKRG